MKQSILITSGAIGDVLQWRYDGKTYQEISDLLLKEKGIKMAYQSIWAVVEKLKIKKQEKVDAQEILYNNRKDVTRMKREFYSNLGIANKFGVTEQDVEEFLSKRRRLSRDDYRDIREKWYVAKVPIEVIADEYGINSKTVEQIINKQKVITSSPIVKSRYDEIQKEALDKKYSIDTAKDFMDLIHTIGKRYEDALNEIDNYNNIRNNIYHQLELSEGTQEEKLEMLNKIQTISTDRRELKNFVETVKPLVDFLQIEKNKKVFTDLARILNDITLNKEKLEKRVYFVRDEDKGGIRC